MGKMLCNSTKDKHLQKTGITSLLNMFGEEKVCIKSHTKVSNSISRVEKVCMILPRNNNFMDLLVST